MPPRRDARALLCLAALLLLLAAGLATEAVWPPDPSAPARPQDQELAAQLHLQWVREYPPQKPAWPDQPRLQFDAGYRPVALSNTLFVGSTCSDSMTALDLETGQEKWRFYTDGPV